MSEPQSVSDLSEEERDILRTAALFRELTTSPGWTSFLALVEKRGGMIANSVLKTPTMDSAKDGWEKGTLFGLQLAASLPSATISEADQILAGLDEPPAQSKDQIP